jgi:hypothetical protein
MAASSASFFFLLSSSILSNSACLAASFSSSESSSSCVFKPASLASCNNVRLCSLIFCNCNALASSSLFALSSLILLFNSSSFLSLSASILASSFAISSADLPEPFPEPFERFFGFENSVKSNLFVSLSIAF